MALVIASVGLPVFAFIIIKHQVRRAEQRLRDRQALMNRLRDL